VTWLEPAGALGRRVDQRGCGSPAIDERGDIGDAARIVLNARRTAPDDVAFTPEFG
jgi:hypothetical protein